MPMRSSAVVAKVRRRALVDAKMLPSVMTAPFGRPVVPDRGEDLREWQAEDAGVFCMEAMWTRHQPLMGRLREMLASNRPLHSLLRDQQVIAGIEVPVESGTADSR